MQKSHSISSHIAKIYSDTSFYGTNVLTKYTAPNAIFLFPFFLCKPLRSLVLNRFTTSLWSIQTDLTLRMQKKMCLPFRLRCVCCISFHFCDGDTDGYQPYYPLFLPLTGGGDGDGNAAEKTGIVLIFVLRFGGKSSPNENKAGSLLSCHWLQRLLPEFQKDKDTKRLILKWFYLEGKNRISLRLR